MELESSSFQGQPVNPLIVQLGLQGERVRFSQSGRHALGEILKALSLRDGVLLVPDFYCHASMMEVFGSRRLKSIHYPVNSDLTPDSGAILKHLAEPKLDIKAILLVSFFGIVRPKQAALDITRAGFQLPIILDSVQDLNGAIHYRETASWAPWQFFSLAKFLPLPNGGFALGPGIESGGVAKYENEATLLSVTRMAIRGLAQQIRERGGESEAMDSLYVKLCESDLDVDPDRGASDLSIQLASLIDLPKMFEHRQANFEYLRSKLQAAEITHIPSEFPSRGPLVLPIRVSSGSRNDLKTELYKNKILAPIHWPQGQVALDGLGENTRRLNQEILSLPIDQRYGRDDMNLIAQVIENFLAHP